MFKRKQPLTLDSINKQIEKSYRSKDFSEDYKTIQELNFTSDTENLVLSGLLESVKYLSKKISKDNKRLDIYPFDFLAPKIVNHNKCHINESLKVITSPVKSVEEITAFDIKIKESSNGFPGNTHEAFLNDKNIVFNGEKNLNLDISNLHKDHKFFEYEGIKLSSTIKNKIKMFGLYYKENISWELKDDFLHLELELINSENTPCNFLNINPIGSNKKNYPFPKIDSIKIYKKDNSYIELIKEVLDFKQSLSFSFDTIVPEKIIISFNQYSGYDTFIGHYFKELNNIRFPVESDSIKSLGMDFNFSENKVINQHSNMTINENMSKIELFNNPNDLELLKAIRYSIGIDSVRMFNYEFQELGEIISNTYYLDKANKVKVLCNSNLPVSLYVRINNDSEWTPVQNNEYIQLTQPIEPDIQFKAEIKDINTIIYDIILITEEEDE